MDCHLLRPAGHITKPCLDCLFQMPFPPALKSRSQRQGHRQWVTNLLMTEELLMDLPSYGAELLGRGLTKKGEQKGIFKLWFFGQMNTTTNKGRSGFGWFESKHFFFPPSDWKAQRHLLLTLLCLLYAISHQVLCVRKICLAASLSFCFHCLGLGCSWMFAQNPP